MSQLKRSKLVVRTMDSADIDAVIALSQAVYGKDWAMSQDMLKGQLRHFPEGQFVAVYGDEIVGHCATFMVSEKTALSQHSWKEITGGGFASRHDELGEFLYGMEVCVGQNYRGLRIGQRLYDARKNLCQEYELKGIAFGGRMPAYKRQQKKVASAREYLQKVKDKELRDPVIGFQMKNGFEPIDVLKDYLTSDEDSLGYAALMVWYNPLYKPTNKRHPNRASQSVRVAAVQFQARKVASFEEFADQLEYFVDVAADYRSDFVCFPEMLTVPLLSAEKERLSPEQGIIRITEYTDVFIAKMQQLAISYNINIIGGSHPTRTEDGSVENICYVFLRSGEVHAQPKLHPTPSERNWWNIKGGNTLKTIDTDCGPIGVLICYDSEFPETARHLTDQGAQILFVPFCTDEKQGYNRVRYCAQARAVENQMYVVLAGIVGNLPSVENMDIHYAESCILTPCDFPFARDGIAATSAPNTEMIVFADLRMDSLTMSRSAGTVMNLKDRRFDLYRVEWIGGKKA